MEHQKDKLDSLLLLIATTKNLVKFSMDPTSNYKLILSQCDLIQPQSANIVLFLLSEILQDTAAVHIPKLIDCLNELIIVKKLGHRIILNMILDGLVQVMAYPSFAGKQLSSAECLLNHIRCENKTSSSDTSSFTSPCLSINSHLSNARDLSIMLETKLDFQFKRISNDADRCFWIRNQLVLRGFLHSDEIEFQNWTTILLNLIDVSKNDENLKNSLVMPLLFKLSGSSNPRMKLAILQNIIQLGATNEIFSTIKALSIGLLRSMSIDLHLRMWRIEPRTYPFLLKALTEKNKQDVDDKYLDIVRAATIKEICDSRPQHGTELVSLISEILNQSLNTKDGEIPAALAIESITILCQNHIINIVSTWKAISLTTRYEKRPRVIKSLCKFFAIVPSLKRTNLEYENLMKEIFARLWHMVQWGGYHEIECALDAIKSWNYDTLTLDMIPDTFREGIALPVAPTEAMEVSILDLEVPGECYVQLLMKVHLSALSAAGNLLIHYISCEIAEFRSGHYIVKDNHPEPINYKNLPKQSILKALIHFLIQQTTTKKAEKQVDEAIVLEVLRILAHKYLRPLPPLNWCFLHELFHKSAELKTLSLMIAAKQSIISGTAKRLIENFIISIDGQSAEDVYLALDCLDDLCAGVSSEVIRTFMETVIKNYRDDSLFFDKIQKCLQQNISNQDNLIQVMSIVTANCELPVEVIQVIPPKLLDAINYQLTLKQRIRFRCEVLKKNDNVENQIGWITELMMESIESREYFTQSFMNLLLESDKFPKKKFTFDLIIIMQNMLVEKDFDIHKITFYLEIFATSIAVASGYFRMLDDAITVWRIFAQSIQLLSQHLFWSNEMGKFFEFMLHILSSNLEISSEISSAFKSGIILCRDHSYFAKPKLWQKFVTI